MKLTEVENPVSGQKVDVLKPFNWIAYIGGAVFLSFVLGFGQYVVKMITARIPQTARFATNPLVDNPTTVVLNSGGGAPIRTVYGGAN